MWAGSSRALYDANDVVWILGVGNSDITDCDAGNTLYDETADVRYSESDVFVVNETNDFVWIGVSLDIPSDEWITGARTGIIYIHFKSMTYYYNNLLLFSLI